MRRYPLVTLSNVYILSLIDAFNELKYSPHTYQGLKIDQGLIKLTIETSSLGEIRRCVSADLCGAAR